MNSIHQQSLLRKIRQILKKRNVIILPVNPSTPVNMQFVVFVIEICLHCYFHLLMVKYTLCCGVDMIQMRIASPIERVSGGLHG